MKGKKVGKKPLRWPCKPASQYAARPGWGCQTQRSKTYSDSDLESLIETIKGGICVQKDKQRSVIV